ncbi:MAG: flagellar basal body P-ring protein FlgI [Bacteroidota bacterium]
MMNMDTHILTRAILGKLLVGITLITTLVGLPTLGFAQSTVEDLVNIRNAQERTLIGYGLVTGLDRTGDRTIRSQGAAFTVQSISNMLQNFGINVDPDELRTRNVAAVMVTAKLGPYHQPGSSVDVTISSLGDATSLVGGVLLQTPLIDPNDEEVRAQAQGPLIVGGISAQIPGASVKRNQTLTARIPGGGMVKNNYTFSFDRSKSLDLVMKTPSTTNAQRIANAINDTMALEIANVYNAGLIRVSWPPQVRDIGQINRFVAQIMEAPVELDIPSRVVINERTGTIVAGGKVKIAEVLVSHGNVQIETRQTPFVSQPAPLSVQGETVTGNIPSVSVGEESAQTVVLEPNTNVTQLAASLNQLGLTPRDIIAIFQAIDAAGALQAELIIM